MSVYFRFLHSVSTRCRHHDWAHFLDELNSIHLQPLNWKSGNEDNLGYLLLFTRTFPDFCWSLTTWFYFIHDHCIKDNKIPQTYRLPRIWNWSELIQQKKKISCLFSWASLCLPCHASLCFMSAAGFSCCINRRWNNNLDLACVIHNAN